ADGPMLTMLAAFALFWLVNIPLASCFAQVFNCSLALDQALVTWFPVFAPRIHELYTAVSVPYVRQHETLSPARFPVIRGVSCPSHHAVAERRIWVLCVRLAASRALILARNASLGRTPANSLARHSRISSKWG